MSELNLEATKAEIARHGGALEEKCASLIREVELLRSENKRTSRVLQEWAALAQRFTRIKPVETEEDAQERYEVALKELYDD